MKREVPVPQARFVFSALLGGNKTCLLRCSPHWNMYNTYSFCRQSQSHCELSCLENVSCNLNCNKGWNFRPKRVLLSVLTFELESSVQLWKFKAEQKIQVAGSIIVFMSKSRKKWSQGFDPDQGPGSPLDHTDHLMAMKIPKFRNITQHPLVWKQAVHNKIKPRKTKLLFGMFWYWSMIRSFYCWMKTVPLSQLGVGSGQDSVRINSQSNRSWQKREKTMGHSKSYASRIAALKEPTWMETDWASFRFCQQKLAWEREREERERETSQIHLKIGLFFGDKKCVVSSQDRKPSACTMQYKQNNYTIRSTAKFKWNTIRIRQGTLTDKNTHKHSGFNCGLITLTPTSLDSGGVVFIQRKWGSWVWVMQFISAQ